MGPNIAGLEQAPATSLRVEAGRVAHYLYWIQDAEYGDDVISLLQERYGYGRYDIVWGYRWGVTWSLFATAQALAGGLDRGSHRLGQGRIGYGEVLCLLDGAAGDGLWDILLGVRHTHGAGWEEIVRSANALIPCTPLHLATAHRLLATKQEKGTFLFPEAVGSVDLPAPDDDDADDAFVMLEVPLMDSVHLPDLNRDATEAILRKAGIRDAEGAVDQAWSGLVPPRRRVAPSTATAEAVSLWTQAFATREDGRERLDDAIRENRSDLVHPHIDRPLLRDAVAALSEATTGFMEGVARFREGGKAWEPPAEWTLQWTPAAVYCWGADLHRDVAYAAFHLGDIDGALRMSATQRDLAEIAGDYHKAAQARTGEAVMRLVRRSEEYNDLDVTEALLQEAAGLYQRAGVGPFKLMNVAALMRDLADARAGREVQVRTAGVRFQPNIPAHGALVTNPAQRRRSH